MVGKIKGTGSYRPVQVWDNDKLSHMMDTSDEWIRGRTGIGQRHIASGGETVAYMAARAAEEALSDAGMRPEEIDFLLVSTMSSERIMPCAACEVQKLIGAVNAACFDLNGACTGFLLALNTAQAYLGQQIYRRALVIGSENSPPFKANTIIVSTTKANKSKYIISNKNASIIAPPPFLKAKPLLCIGGKPHLLILISYSKQYSIFLLICLSKK